jgi:hypothetical protein
VLDALTFGAQDIAEGQAVVKFQQQVQPADTESGVPIVGKVFVHDTLDIAVLRIKPTISRKLIALSTAAPVVGDRVVTIGYPSDDSNRNPLFIQEIGLALRPHPTADSGAKLELVPV